MRLRILGAGGSETPRHSPPGYLVDDNLLVDAGTVASVLSEAEQLDVRWVLLSHAHLDHIRDIPFLADNRLMQNGPPLSVIAPGEVLDAVRTHVFNDVLWPDFSRIPDTENPILRFQELPLDAETPLGSYGVCPVRVNHVVPAFGYRIRRMGEDGTLLYSGDTGPTTRLWEVADGVDVLLVEVSFPDEMEDLAVASGHLTPSLLEEGLRLTPVPPRKILVVHAKPAFRDRIARELVDHGTDAILVARGDRYEI